MRVVGGTLGGRRFEAARSSALRPTSERAREAMFNMLASMDLPSGATVLDLFCGSGALGIEALSRDAAHAVFVDADTVACQTVKANLALLGLAEVAAVVRSDVVRYLAEHDDPVTVAFADPPYRTRLWHSLLDEVKAEVLVCESDREIQPDADQRWHTHRVRRYGTAVVTVLTSS